MRTPGIRKIPQGKDAEPWEHGKVYEPGGLFDQRKQGQGKTRRVKPPTPARRARGGYVPPDYKRAARRAMRRKVKRAQRLALAEEKRSE